MLLFHSSLELPYVTPLENKRKSFNSKALASSSTTTTTITRPIPPKPRGQLLPFQLTDLLTFLFSHIDMANVLFGFYLPFSPLTWETPFQDCVGLCLSLVPSSQTPVPRVKLEDFRPPLLAKFLFNEPVAQELGNSSGSEGEKDISPPPEWDCVPLHIAHNGELCSALPQPPHTCSKPVSPPLLAY